MTRFAALWSGAEGSRPKSSGSSTAPFVFFPVEPDPDLGWRLNFWDVAVNKVLALAGRSEVRDWVDVLHLHARHLHLGALAWAGTGKDPGLSPEAIIRWGGRQAVYRTEDLADLTLSEPVTLPQLKERWLEASSAALHLIAGLPLAKWAAFIWIAPASLSARIPPQRISRDSRATSAASKEPWPRIVESES